MKSPYILAFMAVSIGLVCAAAGLYVLKPQDVPLSMPGSAVTQSGKTVMAPEKPSAPPFILLLGDKNAARVVHVVLDGLNDSNKAAYTIARQMQQDNNDMAVNIVPVMEENTPAYMAFAWALAASDTPEQQAAFIDSLMGTSGDISPQVLTLLAQNNGLDADKLARQATSPEVAQAMALGNNVLPPAVPAIFTQDGWLSGETLKADDLNKSLGQNAAATSDTRLVVSDAYAFATAPAAKTAAIFLTVKNMGTIAAQITGASTSVAPRAEIHTMTMDGNVMKMRKASAVDVKPSETVVFDPMGMHVMLFDLPAPLAVGQKFPLTLVLQGGSELSTFVTVTAPGQALTNHTH